MSRPTVPNLHTQIRTLTDSNFIFIPANKHRTNLIIQGDTQNVRVWVGRPLDTDIDHWMSLEEIKNRQMFSYGVYGPIFLVSAGGATLRIMSPLMEQILVIDGPPTEPEPPVIDVQPVPVTVDEPEPATFSIEVSHPQDADLFYDWQANIGAGWVPVEIAFGGRATAGDQPSFTIDPTESSNDDNAEVRCRVRAYDPDDDSYQVWSDQVLLTVEAAAGVEMTMTVGQNSAGERGFRVGGSPDEGALAPNPLGINRLGGTNGDAIVVEFNDGNVGESITVTYPDSTQDNNPIICVWVALTSNYAGVSDQYDYLGDSLASNIPVIVEVPE